jgi:uncharacterized protein
MTHAEGDSGPLIRVAIGSELGLAAAAYVLGWLTGFWPRWSSGPSPLAMAELLRATALGVVAGTVLSGLLLSERWRWRPLRRLRRLVLRHLVPLFRGARPWQLALICLSAGVGEELLFRGWLQAGLAGTPLAIVVGSLVFGICHWISTSYLVAATGVGIFLGVLFVMTDHLLAPIVAHAVYDYVALRYLLAVDARTRTRAPSAATGP